MKGRKVPQNVVDFSSIIDAARKADPANARGWYEQLELVSFEGGTLKVLCPTTAIANFLSENCRHAFTAAAQTVTGHLLGVEFICEEIEENYPQFQPQQNCANHDIPYTLHPDLTFDNFVVGQSNRLAHASCVAISNSLGVTYNPLFIHSNAGLGKTHLLHAICTNVASHNQNLKIRFLTCEAFVSKFVEAIENGDLLKFQETFRNVDMLILDDVQFLSDRESSQDEFFHTFNALHSQRKQIVLSADRAPSEIPSLDERLLSRFKWGLVARIDKPSFETRLAIVKKKARIRGIDIPEDAASAIASKITSNIREIEGAITTLGAIAYTDNAEIDINLCNDILGCKEVEPQSVLSFSDVIEAVVKYFKVKQSDLKGKSRQKSIVRPRQITMYLARHKTKMSLEEIGYKIGGRDHSTVMHSIDKIAKLSREDKLLKQQIKDLENLLDVAKY
ncbi:chromosomal replication initiator protein DnaA [Sedimentisphaera cyanobacteriorum]|uniref:chromosomal replication initiator protein DnaA n=1 Tax=Sedimentisphaera cyanobacteriorum TaxID=1940790 RepID=UPI001373329C|nr:chromosomal replication initiator protein DnaA [Sedimentisphaera cyanobacteriorum]